MNTEIRELSFNELDAVSGAGAIVTVMQTVEALAGVAAVAASVADAQYALKLANMPAGGQGGCGGGNHPGQHG